MRPRRQGLRRATTVGDRGAVTAEAAMVLPVLVAMTVGLVWLLSLASAQLRVIDAARESARSAARGDDLGAAVAAGERVAPEGGRVDVSVGGDRVVAQATAQVDGPGLVFSWLPGVTVQAEAVALVEGESGGGSGLAPAVGSTGDPG